MKLDLTVENINTIIRSLGGSIPYFVVKEKDIYDNLADVLRDQIEPLQKHGLNTVTRLYLDDDEFNLVVKCVFCLVNLIHSEFIGYMNTQTIPDIIYSDVAAQTYNLIKNCKEVHDGLVDMFNKCNKTGPFMEVLKL